MPETTKKNLKQPKTLAEIFKEKNKAVRIQSKILNTEILIVSTRYKMEKLQETVKESVYTHREVKILSSIKSTGFKKESLKLVQNVKQIMPGSLLCKIRQICSKAPKANGVRK